MYLVSVTKLAVTVSMRSTLSTRWDSARVTVILKIVRLALMMRGEISLARSVTLTSLLLLMGSVLPAISRIARSVLKAMFVLFVHKVFQLLGDLVLVATLLTANNVQDKTDVRSATQVSPL